MQSISHHSKKVRLHFFERVIYTYSMKSNNYKKTDYYFSTDRHPNGLVKSQGLISKKSNHAEGEWSYYNLSARLTSRGNYRDGKKQGTWLEIDWKTGLVSKTEYNIGKKKTSHSAGNFKEYSDLLGGFDEVLRISDALLKI